MTACLNLTSPGHSVHLNCCGKSVRLALLCHCWDEEAGQRLGKALGWGRGHHHQPLVPEAVHLLDARQCRTVQQPVPSRPVAIALLFGYLCKLIFTPIFRKLWNRSDFSLAVTISVDNRRLVVRLVPAGTRTEAEVLKLGYKFDFRFFQLKLEAFSLSLYRFAALARRQLVPGSVRFWGRVEVRLLIICFLLIVRSRILGDASLLSNFTGTNLNLKLRFPLRKAGCSVWGTFPPAFPIPGWLTSSTG